MRSAAAASPSLQVGPVPVPVGAPEHLAGRKPQYAGAAASAEEDGGSPSPGPDGLKWGEGCAAERPLRRFTWSRSPAARSVSTAEHRGSVLMEHGTRNGPVPEPAGSPLRLKSGSGFRCGCCRGTSGSAGVLQTEQNQVRSGSAE